MDKSENKNKNLADTFIYPAVDVESIADGISEMNQTDIINFILHIDSNMMDSAFTDSLIMALKNTQQHEPIKCESCGTPGLTGACKDCIPY